MCCVSSLFSTRFVRLCVACWCFVLVTGALSPETGSSTYMGQSAVCPGQIPLEYFLFFFGQEIARVRRKSGGATNAPRCHVQTCRLVTKASARAVVFGSFFCPEHLLRALLFPPPLWCTGIRGLWQGVHPQRQASVSIDSGIFSPCCASEGLQHMFPSCVLL